MIIFFGLVAAVILGISFLIAFMFRRVVATNYTHIVQSRQHTTSYGKDSKNGNVYYEWPAFIPYFGVSKIVLPVSVFDLDLKSYEAYDKGRLPFVIDVKAFFRITNSDIAAQRVSSFDELVGQLTAIVQGAARTILASNEIEEIMQGRSKFGLEFTNEVEAQLKEWGVETVKHIELMDIRDANGSHVIKNIMEKRKSHIEMQSRTEVAKNMREAQTAELEARREVQIKEQEVLQSVGLRKAEVEREVGIATEKMNQEVKEQARATKEKDMAVIRVEEVKRAEIEKDVKIVLAEQEKQQVVIAAEAKLESQRKEADGIAVQATAQAEATKKLGEAKADAEKAMQLAPVSAQITLAKEIGENQSYQEYLISVRKIEAGEKVGIEQAHALTQADVKVIANTGAPSAGLTSVMDLFSSKGGTEVGAMLEALAQTDAGKKVVSKVVGNGATH